MGRPLGVKLFDWIEKLQLQVIIIKCNFLLHLPGRYLAIIKEKNLEKQFIGIFLIESFTESMTDFTMTENLN